MTQRTILFRGRDDKGKWHEGYYTAIKGTHYISEDPEDGLYYDHAIDHATVGQFTGRVDKNGVKIFEGDIEYQGWVVCFESGVFCIKQSVNSETFIPFSDIYETEIIGNIHTK